MCHPSVGTSHFLKRNGFPASPADYRRSPGAENRPTIGLRDFGSVARVRDALRAATWRTGKLELWDPRGAARGGSTPAAVARQQSFTRAAAQLGVSQPA